MSEYADMYLTEATFDDRRPERKHRAVRAVEALQTQGRRAVSKVQALGMSLWLMAADRSER